MTASHAGLALIKAHIEDETGLKLTESFESCPLVAYWDGTYLDAAKTQKRWSIGWGTTRYPTGVSVREGDTCTQIDADAWLDHDLAGAEDAVNRLVKVDITQNQFDALCDFAYNLGQGALAGSTLLTLLNCGASAGIVAMQFPRWDMDNGEHSGGLLRRRVAEQRLFLTA